MTFAATAYAHISLDEGGVAYITGTTTKVLEVVTEKIAKRLLMGCVYAVLM
jgi:hypothetical protein